MKCVPVHHGIPAVLHRDEPWLHRHSENGALGQGHRFLILSFHSQCEHLFHFFYQGCPFLGTMIIYGVLISAKVSDHQYDFRGNSQSHINLESVLWLVLRVPLLVLTKDVHIWSTDCLWCVDYNEGFISPIPSMIR